MAKQKNHGGQHGKLSKEYPQALADARIGLPASSSEKHAELVVTGQPVMNEGLAPAVQALVDAGFHVKIGGPTRRIEVPVFDPATKFVPGAVDGNSL